MCIDNPREGFADLFATHPPIESRIKALIEFAGGHDPGPLDLPAPGEPHELGQQSTEEPADAGPQPDKPFLPAEPPVVLGGGSRAEPEAAGQAPGSQPGPWDAPRRN
jgi:heat shock protein HtpX